MDTTPASESGAADAPMKDIHNFDQLEGGSESQAPRGKSKPKAEKGEKPKGKEGKQFKDGSQQAIPPSDGVDAMEGTAETKETLADGKGEDVPEDPGMTPKKDKTEFKPVKAKNSEGEEIELDPYTSITRKVNGKTQEFSLHEIIDGFTGSVAIKEKFNEANREKQKAQSLFEKTKKEREEIIGAFTQAGELAREGKTTESLMLFAEALNIDPLPVVDAFRKSREDAVRHLKDVPEEEFRLKTIEEENAQIKGYLNRKKEQEAQKTQKSFYLEKVQTAVKQFGVTVNEIQNEKDWFEVRARRGEVDPNFMRDPGFVEYLAQSASRGKLLTKISNELPKILPEKAGDQQFMGMILEDVVQNPDFTYEDFVAIANNVKKSKEKAKNTDAAKKLSEKVVKGQKTALSQNANGGQMRDVWDWDAL